jgi:hypothetical protein
MKLNEIHIFQLSQATWHSARAALQTAGSEPTLDDMVSAIPEEFQDEHPAARGDALPEPAAVAFPAARRCHRAAIGNPQFPIWKLACALADRHYSRRKVGSPQFMPPGQTIVLLTEENDAVFGWWRPDPKAGIKQMNNLDGWTCTIFRNARFTCDHIIALINGGENRETNLQILCDWCDPAKTAADVRQKAKVYRAGSKQFRGFRESGRPLPGSRASGIRKRMDGGVEAWS